MTVFQLTCQYAVNNSSDLHNISQQFYMMNLDLSPHVSLKDNPFHRSHFFQFLKPLTVNASDPRRPIDLLAKM
jgi:hypothetical protein